MVFTPGEAERSEFYKMSVQLIPSKCKRLYLVFQSLERLFLKGVTVILYASLWLNTTGPILCSNSVCQTAFWYTI